MTETTPTPQPEFLFSAQAFNAAQKAGATALVCEREELAELITFINDHSQRQPLPNPDEMTFIAMHPARTPWNNDKHYYQTPGSFPFVDSRLLGTSENPPATISKAKIEEGEPNIFEYRPWTPVGGMTRWIARRGFGPPPNEAKIIASAEALSNQWTGLKTNEANRLEEEAVKKFPGAVRIEHRSARRTVG
jgi:hypothetical protein